MCEAETAAIAAKLRAKLDKVRLLFSRFPALYRSLHYGLASCVMHTYYTYYTYATLQSAPKLAKVVLGIGGKEWPENLKPGLVTEELKYVVGSVMAVAQGSTRINAQMDPKTMQVIACSNTSMFCWARDSRFGS